MSLSLGMHTHTIWIGKWYKRRHINSITIPEIHPELYASSLLLVILPLNSLALHTYLIWKKKQQQHQKQKWFETKRTDIRHIQHLCTLCSFTNAQQNCSIWFDVGFCLKLKFPTKFTFIPSTFQPALSPSL